MPRKKKVPIVCPFCGEAINVGQLMAINRQVNMSRRDRAIEKKRLKGLRKATMKPKITEEEVSK